jgi:hypothetical protein
VPALQRFYGGDIQAWMEMPQVALMMFQSQMARLRAQECLIGRLVIAMGSGSVKEADHNRIYAAWQKEAGMETTAIKQDSKQIKARLGAFGIGT